MSKPGSEPKPSWEAIVSAWVTLAEKGEELSWARADLARETVRFYGKEAIKQLAQAVGVTAAYVRDLVATANRFPEPEDRLAAAPITFSHFKVAARTEEPKAWIERAVANEWSVRDLSREIQVEKDPFDRAQRYLRERERLEQAVRKFNERWSEVGEEAALEWRERKTKQGAVA